MDIDDGRINFIFVTHESMFAKSFAEYVVFIVNSVIVEHGEVDILEHPQLVGLKAFQEK